MTGLILDAPDEPLTDLSFIGLDPSVSAYAAESRPSQVPTPAQDAAPQSFAAAMAQAHAASADQTSPDGAGTRATAGTGGATGPWDGDAYNSGTYTEDGELLTGSSDPSKFTGPLTGSTTTGGTFELVQGVWRFNPNSEGAKEMYGSAQAASEATGVPLEQWWGGGPPPPGESSGSAATSTTPATPATGPSTPATTPATPATTPATPATAGPWGGDAYNSGTYTNDGELLTGSSDPSKFTGPLTGSITTGGTFELVQGVWRFNPNSEGAKEMYGSAQAASEATGVPLEQWWGDGPPPPGESS